jgi:hypothetical protein
MDTRTIKEQLREIEEELKREVLRLCGELGIKRQNPKRTLNTKQ